MSEDTVDSHDLARALIQQRQAMPRAQAEELMGRFGLDASRTITEIEGIELNDAVAWGDLPELRALRHVPVSHLTPSDVGLLLAYRESTDVVLPLARLILERTPLIQVQHFRGDLLLFMARCVAGLAFSDTVHVPTHFDTPPQDLEWAVPLVARAEETFWSEFSRAADGRKEADYVTAREALRHGTSSRGECWHSRFEDLINTLAEARAWLEPPFVIKRALVNALYVAPKSGRLQIIAPEDFDEMSGQVHHSFERLTVFEIIRRKSDTGMNVTLVSRAPSSIEDWRGRRAGSAQEAMKLAEDLYGLPELAWYDCDADESSPANHFDLD